MLFVGSLKKDRQVEVYGVWGAVSGARQGDTAPQVIHTVTEKVAVDFAAVGRLQWEGDMLDKLEPEPEPERTSW
jgi:hypothetical protein